LDVTAPRKKFKIPRVWDKKKWFLDEIRESVVRRNEENIQEGIVYRYRAKLVAI